MKVKLDRTKAHQKYYLLDGTRVDGVTTIIDRNLGWNKKTLMAWAKREALAGNDPDKVRDKAADIGTVAHFMIECHVKGDEPDLSEYSPAVVDKAENCFIAFLDWAKANDVVYLDSEKQLVSEQYEYGGTRDLYAIVNGEHTIIDFKTGSGVYPEYWIQMAGLTRLQYEYDPDSFDWGDYISWPLSVVLHLGKDGSFSHHKKPKKKIYKAWQALTHLLALDKLREEVK